MRQINILAAHNMLNLFLFLFSVHFVTVDCLHLKGSWKTSEFFRFLAKFGFQRTNPQDKLNTQGYIYGNITSRNSSSSDFTLVVVDSEYFLEFYGNRSVKPRTKACPAMFNKISTIAYNYDCNPSGDEDFLRNVPCAKNQLCIDEDTPERVVPEAQFTYAIQDLIQARFWYMSLVSCSQNLTSKDKCSWISHTEDVQLDFNVWLVNGNPFTKHHNPFEHQFSFELHDIFEIYLAFFIVYTFLMPVQIFSLSRQKHTLPLILTICMTMEYFGVIFNFLHIFKFAFDGVGIDMLRVVGNFIDQIAQCVFMLLLLLIAKGWTITRINLTTRDQIILFSVWGAYTVANLCLFIWNLMEIDFISDTDEWQTWPGYLILAFRILIMGWFLLELREIFVLEPNKDKIRFYLHFGAGFLVWFVYLPIVAVIGTQVSAFWRHKTIISVMYSADFISYVVFAHLLWPSRSRLYFNLKVVTRPFSLDDLEFSGFKMDLDLDTEDSEESLITENTENRTLLKMINSSAPYSKGSLPAKSTGESLNRTGNGYIKNNECTQLQNDFDEEIYSNSEETSFIDR